MDALASAAHYVDHLAAVFDALPPDARGSFLTSDATTTAKAKSRGYPTARPNGGRDPVLVASYGDLARAKAMGRRQIAIMEHGAGQSYSGRGGVGHGSYAGGAGRGAASLFLHPGEHPAQRDRKMYPKARIEAVGSPYLDSLPRREGTPDHVIAITFHFNGAICAETKTAYPAFFPAITRLTSKYKVLGTAHPMLWSHGHPGHRIADRYRAAGIEPVEDFAEVSRRADLLIFDNTSVGFAFAATGRPVVPLNAPWYDHRVDHGLRFWDAAEVGLNCNDPADLEGVVAEAFRDPPAQQAKREDALSMVYAYRTGASQRAADVLMDWAA